MVLKNRAPLVSQSGSNALSFGCLKCDSAKHVVNSVIIIECADILVKHLKRPPKTRPCFSMHAMEVARGINIWASFMESRMNIEAGIVNASLHTCISIHGILI
jgi:hypothetical protein